MPSMMAMVRDCPVSQSSASARRTAGSRWIARVTAAMVAASVAVAPRNASSTARCCVRSERRMRFSSRVRPRRLWEHV